MTHLDFVKAWIELKDEKKIADRLGIDTRRVANLAAMFRSRGVELPKLQRRTRHTAPPTFEDKFDREELNLFLFG